MALDLDADITGLVPADYNPRSISGEDLVALAQSITTLGLVKPIIARGNTIVAGHQRTRALRSLGITRAALYRLDAETTVYDETRLNQIHNSTGLDAGDEDARIETGHETGHPPLVTGWNIIDSNRLRANFRGQLAGVRDEIAVLINRFGPWGGVVADRQGNIIHAAQYALAARLTGTPLTVHVLPDDKIEAATAALGRDYGVFDYAGIERHTYVQTLAQMYRLRYTASDRGNKSWLYEGHVIPAALAAPDKRWLDFGSGHGDYAKALRLRGLKFDDLELFRRVPGANAIDVRSVHAMIDALCARLTQSGLYDATVCDSVLNSVDSPAAESAVMTTLNAFTKLGGQVFFSGRPKEVHASNARITKRVDNRNRRAVEFLDKDGLTAIYRAGHWFFQKFHGKEDVGPMAWDYGLRIEKHVRNTTSWQATSTKVISLDPDLIEAAIRFEFDIEIGASQSLARADDVIRAYRRAVAHERI